MGWTPYQQAAIDERNANILVSAAAGSGKTAVLTERVFRRIIGDEKNAPIDIDRFLIVTFTSAAAKEMKERVAENISKEIERLQKESYDESIQLKMMHLEKQLSLLPKASISTIHSFCLKVVKNYFNVLGVDPNIRVGNESELELMKQELLEELIEEAFEAEDHEQFLKLVDTYGRVNDLDELKKIILGIYTFSKSTVFPSVWMHQMADELCQAEWELGQNRWDKALIKTMMAQLYDLEKIYEKALGITKRVNGPYGYEANIKEDYEQIIKVTQIIKREQLAKLDNHEHFKEAKEILEGILAIQFGRLSTKKQECEPILKERVKAYRDLAKKIVEDLKHKSRLLLDPTLQEKTNQAGALMQSLVQMVETFEGRFQDAKKEKSIVDYNDLEHMCLQLLIQPTTNESGQVVIAYTEVARELAAFYEEIYIDEYQDSNQVQETLLGAIAQAKEDGPTRFMVGDMKQSIYRFRLANPMIFANKYTSFEKYTPRTDEARRNLCIDLSQNFRSREGILDATNDLFEQVMSQEVGELAYDEDAKLKVGNHYQDGEVEQYVNEIAEQAELHLIELDTLEEDSEIEDLKAIEVEAQMVAQLIAQILKGQANPQVVFDKGLGEYRKVEPKDIVILLRSVAEKGQIFEQALMERGIDAYADLNGGFFEAREIQTMLAVLQIFDNPRQDIPLLSVLRSPIVGLDFDELLQIRKIDEQKGFYDALLMYIEAGKASESLQQFYKLFIDYRDKKNLLSVEQLLESLYIETGYYRYVGMLPTGAKKKANLKMLKKYAEEFEANSGVGLFQFIQYMDKLRKTNTKLAEAKLVGEGENLVRIMTIHKSKGLEFPIVFVSNASKKFNNQDIMNNVLMHSELGFGPKYTDQETNILYETVPFQAIKETIVAENISEEMRVLYVALTRAKEKLYITGTTKDYNAQLEKWSQFASRDEQGILPLALKRSPTYMNWIGMSLMAHKSGVTLREQIEGDFDYVFDGQAKWLIKKWSKQELGLQKQELKEHISVQQERLENWDTETTYSTFKALIDKRLNYTYAYESATYLPTKVAVSDLKKKQQEEVMPEVKLFEEALKPIPKFMSDTQMIKGAAKGTIIHSVFEHLDLCTHTTKETIEQALRELVQLGKVVEEALEVVNIQKLEEVAQSAMLERMRQAEYVWKEKAFVYLMDATEVDENYPENEQILLQGVVDNCFIENGQLVIVDYKTDYINPQAVDEGIRKIKSRYQIQLDLYAKALHEITKMPIKEKVIYLYSMNQWVYL